MPRPTNKSELQAHYERAAQFRAFALPYIHELDEYTSSETLVDAMADKIAELGMARTQAMSQLRMMAKAKLIQGKLIGRSFRFKGRGGKLPALPPTGPHWTKERRSKKVRRQQGQQPAIPAGQPLPLTVKPARHFSPVQRVPNGATEYVVNGSTLRVDQGCTVEVTREDNGLLRVVIS